MNPEKLLFITFLKKSDIYNRYIRNFKKCNKVKYFDEMKLNPDMYICRAFTWFNTSEGHDLWLEANSEWRKLLRGGK